MILPADEDYRPTRARALRRQAHRLRRWLRFLRTADVYAEIGYMAVCGVCLLLWLIGLAWGWAEVPSLLVGLYLFGSCAAAAFSAVCERLLAPPVERWTLRSERDAELLEREHHAMYGAHPSRNAA